MVKYALARHIGITSLRKNEDLLYFTQLFFLLLFKAPLASFMCAYFYYDEYDNTELNISSGNFLLSLNVSRVCVF